MYAMDGETAVNCFGVGSQSVLLQPLPYILHLTPPNQLTTTNAIIVVQACVCDLHNGACVCVYVFLPYLYTVVQGNYNDVEF